jgi:hypothetical protein
MYASTRVANSCCGMKVNIGANVRPPGRACSIDRSAARRKPSLDLSKSISVGTRKMVNYA